MGRKDLLKGLMDKSPAAGAGDAPSAETPRRPPRPSRGAIGAVSQSIAELRTRAMIEVPADLIDTAGFRDRLGEDDAGIEQLAASLRDYGQQVPVLLRHSPNHEGRYEVVYGRRRVAALKRLGRPVRAILRQIDDRDLVIAQGQENTARKDLSFIEKANFARQMAAAGYERKVIGDALHVDKTVLSRMLSVVERVPLALIEAIGPAPAAGRTRWVQLAEALEAEAGPQIAALIALARAVGDGAADDARETAAGASDRRFEAVLAQAHRPPAPPAAPVSAAPRQVAQENTPARRLTAQDGTLLARARAGRRGVTLTLAPEAAGFDEWLIDNLPRLHREWRQRQDG